MIEYAEYKPTPHQAAIIEAKAQRIWRAENRGAAPTSEQLEQVRERVRQALLRPRPIKSGPTAGDPGPSLIEIHEEQYRSKRNLPRAGSESDLRVRRILGL